jgi:hypothetical protein
MPLANMEKEMMYYKQANKELKSKLREVMAAHHKLVKSEKRVNLDSNDVDQPSSQLSRPQRYAFPSI